MVVVVMVVSPCFWQIFPTGCSVIFDCPVDRSWCAQRCCDGVAAATEMRRPAPSRSFCASREEPASFPPVDSNFKSWPTVLGQPPGPVIIKTKKNAGKVLGSKPGERQGKPTTQGQGFEYNSRRTRGAEQYRRQYQNGCRRDE